MALRDRLHGHECPVCGMQWEHHPADMHSSAEFKLGHTCPRCGYDGDECRDPIPPASQMETYRRYLGL